MNATRKHPSPAEVRGKLKAMRVRAASAEGVVQEIDNPTNFYHGMGRSLDYAVDAYNKARAELIDAAAKIAEMTATLPSEDDLQDYIVPRPGYARFYGGTAWSLGKRPDYAKCGASVSNDRGSYSSHQCRNTANCVPDDQGRMTRCGVHKNRAWSRWS